MSELGGLDIGAPDEGTGGVSEAASEQASQRFAASQQAAQQQAKEEKKAKKRDDNVAQVILQFLTDEQRTHLATLISRLVAIDCPTTFILALLSLINEQCAKAVNDYARENNAEMENVEAVDHSIIPANGALTDAANEELAKWIVRCGLIMRIDEENILHSLLVDDHNIDGTVLQLTSFVLQEFLHAHQKDVPFENLQHLAAGILQTIFMPAMQSRMERRLAEAPVEDED